jgi:glycosyltransferase involved in cell wall biosynthesis
VHILFLSHYFVPENNAPAARVHAMAREWTRQGHRVTVLTCVPNVPAGVVFDGYRNRVLPQTEWIDGIRTVRVWTYLAANSGRVRRGLNFLSYLGTASATAALLRPRADVVVATSPQFFAGWAGVPAGHGQGAPFVLEVRDIWPDSIVAVGALQRGRLIGALERLERALYDAADHIVAVGEGYRANMIAKGVAPSKIDVVTNGVDADLFVAQPRDEALRASLGFEPGTFVVTFAGTIGMASGLGVALRAAARLQDQGHANVAFLLIGDGAVRGELEAEARARGLHNVVFTGLVAREELPRYLASSDACLVHFRRQELFSTILPSKFFEDAAMEKPILLGFEGEARAMLRQADCGLAFEPDNDEQLAAAALRLAADPAEARRLGVNGRAFVLERFDRRTLAHEYLHILERVRADHERRPR